MVAGQPTHAIALVLAFVVVIDCELAAAAGPMQVGVCYSPWHHPSVTNEIVLRDFAEIKQHFTAIRTYHVRFGSVNVIDAAAQAGIQVAVGVMMQDKSQIANEIAAVCDGAKRHPTSVQAVYVGNENLGSGISGPEMIGYINQVKACVSSLGIPVGTSQRINEWLNTSDAVAVAACSDVIGANIHPFFTPGNQKAVEKLDAQWKQLTNKFPRSKLHVTETGWPRGGGAFAGNTAGREAAQAFFGDFVTWAIGKPTPYYFMMYDTINAYGGGEFEKSFGIANVNGQLQIAMPTSGGGDAKPGTVRPARWRRFRQ